MATRLLQTLSAIMKRALGRQRLLRQAAASAVLLILYKVVTIQKLAKEYIGIADAK